MQNQDYSDQGLVCPSFNSYASATTADTAAKVCREFSSLGLVDENKEFEYEGGEKQDDDFEFVSFQKSADEVFFGDNTRIGPVFPVFNRDLISQRDLNYTDDVDAVPSSSSASSDVDELENVPAGSYCVWMPKTTPASSPSHCKKSKSTGTSSSRRWRLRDLLRRSNSEGGKDSFVLLTPSLTSSSSSKKQVAANDHHHHPNEKMVVTKGKKSFNGSRPKGPNAVSMAHEVFYAKSKEKDGYNKRQSYLPYRKDLVGFFASVNAMGRTFPTF
ncbi:hypothetical protein RchiOBHm_Chr2g0172191 [Rosa chinensis]|uniref:Uncharacterized protein n=1 Tax=Rosa chinensis TaxID=74649 RepID=A0A2P6S5L9_ROSCH|nr:uncharacterized protein LOC112190321 [Rosa chinensis]PRQ53949.1 hypothetical protein RchiOBHm_Chr2g0172191 [Rosa chinensis]